MPALYPFHRRQLHVYPLQFDGEGSIGFEAVESEMAIAVHHELIVGLDLGLLVAGLGLEGQALATQCHHLSLGESQLPLHLGQLQFQVGGGWCGGWGRGQLLPVGIPKTIKAGQFLDWQAGWGAGLKFHTRRRLEFQDGAPPGPEVPGLVDEVREGLRPHPEQDGTAAALQRLSLQVEQVERMCLLFGR